jgi:hypothetical protein
MSKLQLTAFAALAVASQLASGSAFAHIELQSPMNRYSDIKSGDNKSCPCGSGTTNRSCAKPDERADDNRSEDRATTFAPGETITVQFDEYVGHSGRFRIAFDPDGADLTEFNQYILLDVPDPAGNTGNMGQGSLWQFQVTLPNMTCDNCTLQLIQVMDGDMTDPVPDPVLRGGTYFQCADIVLAAGTPAGGVPPANPTAHLGQEMGRLPAVIDGSAGAAGATSASTGSSMAVAAAPSVAMTGTVAPAASAAAASTTNVVPNMGTSSTAMDANDGGGCSLGRAVGGSGWQTLGSFSALLIVGARRRRRSA